MTKLIVNQTRRSSICSAFVSFRESGIIGRGKREKIASVLLSLSDSKVRNVRKKITAKKRIELTFSDVITA
jgi:hypothetical protein